MKEDKFFYLFVCADLVFLLAITVLGAIVYVWTIGLAYVKSGLIAALLSFIFPFFAQIYWFFEVGFGEGFNDAYCITVVALAIVGILRLVFLVYRCLKDERVI